MIIQYLDIHGEVQSIERPGDTYSGELYRRDIALLEEFLLWMNANDCIVSQWQTHQNGEYLVSMSEQALRALPVLFANERGSHDQ